MESPTRPLPSHHFNNWPNTTANRSQSKSSTASVLVLSPKSLDQNSQKSTVTSGSSSMQMDRTDKKSKPKKMTKRRLKKITKTKNLPALKIHKAIINTQISIPSQPHTHLASKPVFPKVWTLSKPLTKFGDFTDTCFSMTTPMNG